MKKKYNLVIALAVAFSLSCSTVSYAFTMQQKEQQLGKVNQTVTTFEDLDKAEQTKNIFITCNVQAILKQGYKQQNDFCNKPKNDDYVSYVTSFDTQMTLDFDVYLNALATSLKKQGKLGDYEKLAELSNSSKDDLARLKWSPTPVSSFVINNGPNTLFFISKNDILPRLTIYPGYRILAVKEPLGQSYQDIANYQMDYYIPPYKFTTNYDDKDKVRLLGGIDYDKAKGIVADTSTTRIFAQYTELFKNFNDNLSKGVLYPYNPNNITEFDYVYPITALDKVLKRYKNLSNYMGNDLDRKIGFLPGFYDPDKNINGFITDFLPSYNLVSIELVIRDKDNEQKVFSISRADMQKLIRQDGANVGLMHVIKNLSDKSIYVKFNYELGTTIAQKPLPSNIANLLGLPYVFSDIAKYENVYLQLGAIPTLQDFPRDCFNGANLGGAAQFGISEDMMALFVQTLDPKQKCSQLQKDITSLILNGNKDLLYFYKREK